MLSELDGRSRPEGTVSAGETTEYFFFGLVQSREQMNMITLEDKGGKGGAH